MDFPLYDSLNINLIDKDLSPSQKDGFIKKVKELDDSGSELMYALIRFHYIKMENDTLSLPYDCKIQKNDMQFDMERFPYKLKQILYTFLKKHAKKMKEDFKLDKDRKEELV